MSFAEILRTLGLAAGDLNYSPDGPSSLAKALGSVVKAKPQGPAAREPKTDAQIMRASIAELTREERERRSELTLEAIGGESQAETPNESTRKQWQAASLQSSDAPKPTFSTDIANVTAPKSKHVPFYHQTDSRGNSMAGLLEMRDAAKTQKERLKVREAIYAWSSEFDAQQRGEKQRVADGTAGDPSVLQRWKEARAAQGETTPQTKEAALKDHLANQVRNQVDPPKPNDTANIPKTEPTKAQTKMDMVQLGLDAAGIADPTPIVDGVNAGISLVRAYKESERRKEHLQNAAISTVSMIPYIGDTAKLLKTGRAAKTVQRGAKMAHIPDAAGNATRGAGAAADVTGGVVKPTRTANRKQLDRLRYREQARGASRQVLGDDEQQPGKPADGVNSQQPPGSPPRNTDPSIDLPPSGGDDQNASSGRNRFVDAVDRGAGKVAAFAEKVASVLGPLGKFTMGLGKGIVKIAGLIKGLEMVNTGVIALNKNLAPYTGQMASAYSRQEMRDIRRDTRKARKLDGPMSELIDAQADLRDSIDRLVVPVQGFIISALAKLTETANGVTALVSLNPIAKAILNSLNKADDSNQATQWLRFFDDTESFSGDKPEFASDKTQQKSIPKL